MFPRLIIIYSIFIFLGLFITGCCCCCCFDNSVPPSNNHHHNYTDNNNNGVASKKMRTMKALVVLCDDYINEENNNIANSIKVDYGILRRLLDRLEDRKIVNVETTVLRGKEATTDNITDKINNLDVGKDDILLFYYSGHGGMTEGNTFLWPCDERNLFRSELQSLINNKDAEFKIIITDACSSSIDSVGYRKILNYTGDIVNEGAYDDIYRNLFLNYRGLLDITAASEGEYAWSDYEGGYFTISLLKEVLLQRPLKTWEEVVDATREKTEDKFREMYNMGLVSEKIMNDMDEKGIKNQSPMTYSMPEALGGNIGIPTEIANEPTQNYQEPTQTPYEAEIKAKIQNGTDRAIMFYVDDNSMTDKWKVEDCKEMSIDPGKEIILKGVKSLKVYYDKGNDIRDYYVLDTGSYYFGADKNSSELIQLYVGNPPDNTLYKESITVHNFNYDDIDVIIEYTSGIKEKHTIKSEDCLTFESAEPVTIYFDDLSYRLVPGSKYYFSFDQYDNRELYVVE